VSCEPEIRIHTRCSGDETLVIACDGIWDVNTNAKCIERLDAAMGKTGGLNGKALEVVLDECLRADSLDNMSILAIDMRQD
jgi:serine/threonine protein phosphatase PrpC